jgi:hypothetical protein
LKGKIKMTKNKSNYDADKNEIYDPEEDYFDVRKQETKNNKTYDPYKKVYKSTFNKENPY